MSSTIMFKCPCCGGYLEFDAVQQKFKCQYCGQVLTEEDVRDPSAPAEESAADSAHAQGSSAMKGYHCQMCGAEIVTEATTAATRCYYCHSPVVLQDRLDDDFRPDGVIPFALDEQTAKQQFMAHVRSKRFIDRRFFDEAQLEMFSGVYYPGWYFDVEGDASFDGEGTRRSVTTTSSHIITTTRYFHVEREAKMSFRRLFRKALNKLDGKLADGIHPYREEDMKPYAPGYLSGFLAETRDVEAQNLEEDVLGEAKGYAEQLIRSGHSFNSLMGDTGFRTTALRKKYVLLPAWALTWKKGESGEPYYYMMNGQTGRVCGRLPINRGKLLGWAIGAGTIVMGLLLAGGKFLW